MPFWAPHNTRVRDAGQEAEAAWAAPARTRWGGGLRSRLCRVLCARPALGRARGSRLEEGDQKDSVTRSGREDFVLHTGALAREGPHRDSVKTLFVENRSKHVSAEDRACPPASSNSRPVSPSETGENVQNPL